VDATTNKGNEGWVDIDPQNYPARVKYFKITKDQVSVMVLHIAASDSQKMHPVSLLAGVKIKAYLDIFSSQVKQSVQPTRWPRG
jgi:hypothetical protein